MNSNWYAALKNFSGVPKYDAHADSMRSAHKVRLRPPRMSGN
jgi:hypothetical protein